MWPENSWWGVSKVEKFWGGSEGGERAFLITVSRSRVNFCLYEWAIARICASLLWVKMLQTSNSSVPVLPSVALYNSITSESICCGITGVDSSFLFADRTMRKCLSVFMLRSALMSDSRDVRNVFLYRSLITRISAFDLPSRISFKTFSFVPGPSIA